MALNRWSLDRLTAWIGTIALVVLFVPMGLYLTHNISSSAEQHLSVRGKSLARTLVGQIVEPVLVEDRLTLHDALHRAAGADSEVRYLCIRDRNGDIVASTFEGGYPPALSDLWNAHHGEVILFRTGDEPLMDVSTPLLDGQLGTLHVGISRSRATRAADRLFWLMGIVLIVTLSVVLIGARIIMVGVGKPLRRLEAAVSEFPQRSGGSSELTVSGTRDVESLAKGFSDMVRRLELLERDRAATQERMIHTERLAALGELAAGLAHEVHNPLDGMQECLRYLQQDPGKSIRAAKYYPMLSDGLQRIARVMREMLTFARSGQNVSVDEYRIVDVLKASQLLVYANIRDRTVDTKWQIPEDCMCMCDPQGLAQALLNLVLNAAEAAEGNVDPQVRIEATYNSQWVYIAVEDSGLGVPEQLRDRVFDAFFTTKPFGKGTGLGLSVSRQFVRAAGGELDLSPEAGSLGGARFVIRLPRARAWECEDGRE